MTDKQRKEKEKYEKIRETIEWIDNDLLRAAKYLLFLKEENEYLKIKVIGSYQIEIKELKAQIEKMKCCSNCFNSLYGNRGENGRCEECGNKDNWELAK